MFNIGDIVVVTMANEFVFNWTYSPSFTATIKHIPQDTGDMWYFESGERIVAINPMSSSFVGITMG